MDWVQGEQHRIHHRAGCFADAAISYRLAIVPPHLDACALKTNLPAGKYVTTRMTCVVDEHTPIPGNPDVFVQSSPAY